MELSVTLNLILGKIMRSKIDINGNFYQQQILNISTELKEIKPKVLGLRCFNKTISKVNSEGVLSLKIKERKKLENKILPILGIVLGGVSFLIGNSIKNDSEVLYDQYKGQVNAAQFQLIYGETRETVLKEARNKLRTSRIFTGVGSGVFLTGTIYLWKNNRKCNCNN